jgi:transposase
MAAPRPRANVAEIARDADLRPGQIYLWRRQMFGYATDFAIVTVQPDPTPPVGPAVAVELGNMVVSMSADTSPNLVAVVTCSPETPPF